MSADAIAFSVIAHTKVAERAAVECPSVYFKVTYRVDVVLLHWIARTLYSLICRGIVARYLPKGWKVPPVPPMEGGGLSTFARAVANCKTKDDQVSAMPWEWVYERGEIHVVDTCRPLDPDDQGRYQYMLNKYGNVETAFDPAIARARTMELCALVEHAHRTIRNVADDLAGE